MLMYEESRRGEKKGANVELEGRKRGPTWHETSGKKKGEGDKRGGDRDSFLSKKEGQKDTSKRKEG